MIIRIDDRNALKGALQELAEYLHAASSSEEGLFHSKLVVSELVGNVFRHSEGGASVTLERTGAFVHLTVHATKPFYPPEKSTLSDVYSESGRGLFIVDSVCEERKTTAEGGICVKVRIQK